MKNYRTRDEEKGELVCSLVAYVLRLEREAMAGKTRGTATHARARQIAMYLCNVCFEMSLARIALAFNRDRSTVAHACHTVEDWRDDPEADAMITTMERALENLRLEDNWQDDEAQIAS